MLGQTRAEASHFDCIAEGGASFEQWETKGNRADKEVFVDHQTRRGEWHFTK